MIFFFIFDLSKQTEAGSAGKQPARDNFDGRRKRHTKGWVLPNLLTFSETYYALKKSNVGFVFVTCSIVSVLFKSPL
jgi:hypothetical protein